MHILPDKFLPFQYYISIKMFIPNVICSLQIQEPIFYYLVSISSMAIHFMSCYRKCSKILNTFFFQMLVFGAGIHNLLVMSE